MIKIIGSCKDNENYLHKEVKMYNIYIHKEVKKNKEVENLQVLVKTKKLRLQRKVVTKMK